MLFDSCPLYISTISTLISQKFVLSSQQPWFFLYISVSNRDFSNMDVRVKGGGGILSVLIIEFPDKEIRMKRSHKRSIGHRAAAPLVPRPQAGPPATAAAVPDDEITCDSFGLHQSSVLSTADVGFCRFEHR